MKKGKRKITKLFLALMVFMMLLSGCNNANAENNPETEETVEARTAIIFKVIEGNGAMVTREDADQSVFEGMRILAGDEIVTDENSSVYLRVDDDKNILLNKNSKITVTECKSGSLLIELEYGDFFFDVENKLSAEEQMIFKIGATSMSIRGTSGAGSKNDDVATFAIYTGKGEITDVLGEGEVCYLEPNEIVEFSPEEGAKEYVVSEVNEENFSKLAGTYAAENEAYQGKLEGWDISEPANIKPDSKKIEVKKYYYEVSKKEDEGQFVLAANNGKVEISHTKDETKSEQKKTYNTAPVSEQEAAVEEYITIVIEGAGVAKTVEEPAKETEKTVENKLVTKSQTSNAAEKTLDKVPDGYEKKCSYVPATSIEWVDGKKVEKAIEKEVCDLVKIEKQVVRNEEKAISYDSGLSISSNCYYSNPKDTPHEEAEEKITDTVISRPSAGKLDFKCDGNEHAPMIGGFNSQYMIMTGTLQHTDVGNYTVTIQLISGFHWSDGGTDSVTFNWSIHE